MEVLVPLLQATGPWSDYISIKGVVGVVVYSVLGMLLFVVGFIVVDRSTPGNLWREILEQKNVAVAILMGALAIAFSIIVSAAIHG